MALPAVSAGTMPIVISLDGNIGAGKTTLLAAIQEAMPDVEVLTEPVGAWTSLVNADGKSLLELFYENKQRWAYTFQTCAFLTRVQSLKNCLATTTKQVIVTERSVLTDRHVFAEMLRASGEMSPIEWSLYRNWFDTLAADMPMSGVIYLTTGVGTSAERIVGRGRSGEEHIPLDYLAALDKQHQDWVKGSVLPVLRLSTESSVPLADNLTQIRNFIDVLSKDGPQ